MKKCLHSLISVIMVAVLCIVSCLTNYIVVAKALDIESLITDARTIIFQNEGGYYAFNANDGGAISVGGLQWHGDRALNLFKMIINANPTSAYNILGSTLYNEILNSTDWSSRIPNATESSALKNLLKTNESIEAQNNLAYSDVKSYLTTGKNYGLTDPATLVYFADLQNQRPLSAKNIVNSAISIVGSASAITLSQIHSCALNDSVIGSRFAKRRNNTYNYCSKLVITDPSLPCKIDDISGYDGPKEGYVHTPGANCGLYGTITSNHTLKHVWGGVYNPDGTPASGSSTTCDDYPSSTSYSLRGKFNNSIIFDDIPEGSYYFSISAEDNDGFKKELIHNNFTVGNPRPSTYSVSLNANDGSVSPTSITVSANGTYSGLPTPDRYGYDFAGWFDDSGRQVWDGVGIYTNSDHTLYARWNPKPVTVYLNANGGSVSSNSIQVNFDNKYSNLPSAEKTGYNFNGWFTASDGGTQVDFNSVCNTVDEHTLFAHWDKNKIMITFNAIGGTVETANKLVVYDNKYGILPTLEKKGYEFKGWYLDESYTKPITKDTIVDVTGNQTVYAKWNIRQFVITFYAGEGTPDVETKRVVFGKAYGVLPEATLGEEVFLGWFTADGTEITSESIVELEKDTVLYAQWRVQGDVNADGVFDKDDIIMVQDWLLAKPNATLTDWHAADVCKDERIDVFDLCILKRMLLERNGDN